jgi:hypothetical protein
MRIVNADNAFFGNKMWILSIAKKKEEKDTESSEKMKQVISSQRSKDERGEKKVRERMLNLQCDFE